MNYFKPTLAAVAVLSFVFALPVYAQDTKVETEIEVEEIEVVDPGLVPGHPLYFLDSFGDRLSLAFTFDKEEKAKKALAIADEKLAELDVIKEKIEFNEIRPDAELMKKAYARYESHMEKADDVAGVLEEREDFGEIAERIAKKRAEHRAALEEHGEVMPEELKVRVQSMIERAQVRQESILEMVENPVARARIQENVEAHKARFLEHREDFLEKKDEVRLRAIEAGFEGIPPEEREKMVAEKIKHFNAVKEKRAEHHAELKLQFETEKAEFLEREAKMKSKMKEAGFTDEEEATEAYEASSEEDRAKLRAFFGVSEEEAKMRLNEVKEMRAEHGDEWQERLREKKKVEADRFERDFEMLERDMEEFDGDVEADLMRRHNLPVDGSAGLPGFSSTLPGDLPVEEPGELRSGDASLKEIMDVYKRDTKLKPGEVLSEPPTEVLERPEPVRELRPNGIPPHLQ